MHVRALFEHPIEIETQSSEHRVRRWLTDPKTGTPHPEVPPVDIFGTL